MPGSASRTNGHKGGRPKGRKSAATIERDAVAAQVRARICQNADRLVNAQLSLAEGCSLLFKIAKGGKHVVVTDADTIKRFLDGELTPDDGYHYITTERPNNFAIVDMLNRGLGKPEDTLRTPDLCPLVIDRVDTREEMLEALGAADTDAGSTDEGD